MNYEQRRLRAYAFSAELIAIMLRHGRKYGCEEGYDTLEITEGIPEGAVIVSAEYDLLGREFVVVVEHESFDPVSEAVPLPKERRVTWRDLPWGMVTLQQTVIEGSK